jgi:pentatricopeptide repeat protein
MYTKSMRLEEAREVFDRLAVHDVVSWTILIAGYSEYGGDSEALRCFRQMQDEEGIAPVEATFLSGLTACGNLGSIGEGELMHSEILRKGLEKEVLIDNALIAMYAKCGLIAAARCLFDRPRSRDVVACNALMAGYAHLGECVSILGILERMRREGIQPDAASFVCIINAYSHEGLLLWKHFEAICEEYGFEPALEHYNCAVDLVARAGRMESAIAIVKKMPLQPSVTIWHTLLGACRKWGDVGLAKYAFDEAVQLDAKDDATYLCMFHIYSVVGMEDEARHVEKARMEVANRFHKHRRE